MGEAARPRPPAAGVVTSADVLAPGAGLPGSGRRSLTSLLPNTTGVTGMEPGPSPPGGSRDGARGAAALGLAAPGPFPW